MWAALNTIKFIMRHPLNRHRPLSALAAFIRWQIGSRLLPGAVAVPFVHGTRLLTKPGMTGATGNIYCGLHEFEDMGLVLHALRPGDLFVDVGANIGSYTVLAAGVCGASVIAIEPIPSTYGHLLDNIHLNNLESLVTAKNIGLGASPGGLRFSDALDTVNHVLSTEENKTIIGISVSVDTLDAVLQGLSPSIIKIDVEGYETEIIKGAQNTLRSDGLFAVLMELNGSGNRYGFDETKLHTEMIDRGFTPCTYAPFARVLTPLKTKNVESGNTLYVRDIPSLTVRLKSAPQRTIHGKSL
jgi:FkbM family methyltransferase